MASTELAAQWFVPILPTRSLDGSDPSCVEGVLRDLEFAHGSVTKCGLGELLRLTGPHVCKQPLPAAFSLGVSLSQSSFFRPFSIGRTVAVGNGSTEPFRIRRTISVSRSMRSESA